MKKKPINSTAQLAAHLGLSRWTVSRAINNHPGIGQATRERVFAAMQQAGFTPSLLARGLRVYLPVDAITSRYAIDRDMALRRLEQAGAIPTTSETCVFEWLGGADHPQFKAVSRMVQERMKFLSEPG